MASAPLRPPIDPTGHIFRVERRVGPVWYAKYRLPDGRQVQKKVGPAWTERGRPPAGYFTRRAAEAWLRDVLEQARRGTLPGLVRTGATFADAAAEFMRYAEYDRALKPSTLRGYRSIVSAYLLPAFGDRSVESITSREIEAWRASLVEGRSGRKIANATRNRILVLTHGIFRRACKVYGLPQNPVAGVERHPQRTSGDIEVFSPEEVWALVRAAANEQDAAIFLTAAFTGMRRGELIALRWRDLDFGGHAVRVRSSYAGGALTAPKSGKVRSMPLAPDVATALAGLSQRDLFNGEDDLVFVGEAGSYIDGSALRRRYKTALADAKLRDLRFHDLRHTFGTRMIARADIRRVQEWMGHADVQTTMRYLHYAPRDEDARLVAEAFQVAGGRGE
jgi:integrase